MAVTSTHVKPPPVLEDGAWQLRQPPDLASELLKYLGYIEPMAGGERAAADDAATFATWLRKAREDAGWTKTEAIRAVGEDGVDIKERTYTHWESGTIEKPDPRQVRKACLRLGLSVHEAAVELGILTREELDLPPSPPAVPSTIRNVLSLLRAPQVPEEAKKSLLRHIQAAVDFWAEQLGVPRPPREPSAADRAKGKPVTKR